MNSRENLGALSVACPAPTALQIIGEMCRRSKHRFGRLAISDISDGRTTFDEHQPPLQSDHGRCTQTSCANELCKIVT